MGVKIKHIALNYDKAYFLQWHQAYFYEMNKIESRRLAVLAVFIFLIAGCTKSISEMTSAPAKTTGSTVNPGYTHYVIEKGLQFADSTEYLVDVVSVTDLHFKVIFDSTAIYKTDTAHNQGDINKLYGFADNAVYDHHEFSARFGWNWNFGKLWLYAYDYNNGVETNKSLGSIPIGIAADCHIIVQGNEYLFVLNSDTTVMPRASTTAAGVGYKLFPYFGGVETAPHTINIYIEEIEE